MPLNAPLIAEFKHEASFTRKMLERVPEEHANWKPHIRSTTLMRLAAHIAEIPLWIFFVLTSDELDLNGEEFKRHEFKTLPELLTFFDLNIHKSLIALENATDEALSKIWILKKDGQQAMAVPKIQMLRSVIYNHLYHHRGQLSVYLRLLDVPVPGMYGPSADD